MDPEKTCNWYCGFVFQTSVDEETGVVRVAVSLSQDSKELYAVYADTPAQAQDSAEEFAASIYKNIYKYGVEESVLTPDLTGLDNGLIGFNKYSDNGEIESAVTIVIGTKESAEILGAVDAIEETWEL